MNAYVNPANAITASRFLTLPAFVYWLEAGEYQLATAAVVVCGVLDLFDGAVARLLGCASGFGELLDAITDAICYAFFMVVLAFHGGLPWIPVVGILGLGAVNALFRFIYARRVGRATNYRSYAMERVVGYTAYLAGLGTIGFEATYYAWTCLGLMAVVVIHDSKRMLIDPVPSDPDGPASGAAALRAGQAA